MVMEGRVFWLRRSDYFSMSFGSSVVLRYAVPWDFSGIFLRRGKYLS